MAALKFKEEYNAPKFELVLQIRDHNGHPTGKTKSFVTDNPEELETYYNRNSGKKKKKKKVVKEVEAKKSEEVKTEK